jgi:ribosomal protein S18 acetylase RimI-like enzyme
MIRKAENNRDFQDIHRLILELAEYEKAPNEVITNPEILQEHCSGVNPWLLRGYWKIQKIE